MACRRAALLLLAATAHLCFMSPHSTAAVSFSYDFSKASDRAKLWYSDESSRANGNSSDADDGINITRVGTGSTGRVAYDGAVRLWDDRTGERASFNTSFSFVIERSGDSRGADGMAFFIGSSHILPTDSNSAFLGLFTNNRLAQPTVGVEFDTFHNADWDPSDITTDHVGIEVGNILNIINYTKGLQNGSLSNGTMEANIMYNASSKLMMVTLQLANGTSVSLQATLDLKDDVQGLGPDAAVGFSAATGPNLFESHQLRSWSFSSDLPSNNNKIKLWVILVLSAASASLTGLVAALLYYLMRRLRRIHSKIPIKLEEVAREFFYNELSAATSNFSKDWELGAGSFGVVYKGELQNPRMPVAVKKLTTLMAQTREDFVTEIKTLGRLSHRNLVKLLGWCSDRELLLVYELVTNGTLDEHLHGPETVLTWPERYKIVLGVGAAIDYLHNGCRNRILHRDIKPSNVMLDDAFDAKLGDFGLVRQLVDTGHGQSSLGGTVMIGTRVYMDPVCISTGTVSTASDVYSFGVLLLEIAGGVKPAVVAAAGGHLSNTLVEAVREAYARGAILDMADKRLKGNFDSSQMERVLAVGRLCVEHERQHRPNIKKAVNLLSDPSLPIVNFLL